MIKKQSAKTISKNIRELVNKGHTREQSIAIALTAAHKKPSKKKK